MDIYDTFARSSTEYDGWRLTKTGSNIHAPPFCRCRDVYIACVTALTGNRLMWRLYGRGERRKYKHIKSYPLSEAVTSRGGQIFKSSHPLLIRDPTRERSLSLITTDLDNFIWPHFIRTDWTVIGRSHDELGLALWSDPVRRYCDQSPFKPCC